jgi:hypothetical protein
MQNSPSTRNLQIGVSVLSPSDPTRIPGFPLLKPNQRLEQTGGGIPVQSWTAEREATASALNSGMSYRSSNGFQYRPFSNTSPPTTWCSPAYSSAREENNTEYALVFNSAQSSG